jgi:glycosyltransferase involved in cell wall biosynthesis
MSHSISIIIPIYNEEKYIKACIQSILESDFPKENMEILLVDGMSSDRTREIIQNLSTEYDFILLLDNPKKTAPIAMNIGVKEAKGEYIFILSAHACYDANYFGALVEYINTLNADCVGGVLETDVKNKNTKSNAIKEVLMHPLGVGNASFRTGSNEIKSVDTVAFGCYRRNTFETYGLFDEKLTRNQDIEFNKRIVNGGGKIYLVPDVRSTYFAREHFLDLAKNNFANGYWNILTAYYTNTFSSLSVRHFIPLLFVLSILLPLLFIPVFPKIIYVSMLSLLSYLTLVIITSIRLKNDSNSIKYLVMSFLVLHFSYGIGSLQGIFSIIKKYIKGE